MRQILYRGKIINTDVFTYGFYFERFIEGEKHSYIKYETFDEGFVTNEVVPDTVGQYTGVRDDKWARVFEGDILEVSCDDGTAYTTEVKAYGNTLCVDVEGEDYDYTAFDFAVDLWRAEGCEFEVVDNIYDKNKDADASIEFLKAVDPVSVYHNF